MGDRDMDAECQHCRQSHDWGAPTDPSRWSVCAGCGRDLQFLVDQLETVAVIRYRLAQLRRSSE